MTARRLTTDATIRRGLADSAGYSRLIKGGGEPHRLRMELTESEGPADNVTPAEAADQVLRFVQLTDFQLADLASPSRLEFLQRLVGRPGWRLMLPSYRPQEFVAVQAIEAIIRTVATLGPVDLALTTGDNIDSSQLNELTMYLRLMDGGVIDPGADSRRLRDTVSAHEGGEYWNPEPRSRDRWKVEKGFPDYPGALDAAAEQFTADGIGVPWLACFGNHDQLVQGRAPVPSGMDDVLTSTHKPHSLSGAVPEDDVIDTYIRDPLTLVASASSNEGKIEPGHPIEARSVRRIVGREEYIRAHLGSPTLPTGHGFEAADADASRAYYVYDEVPGIRMICLDTTNPAGYADGCLDDAQFRWLDDRLREVHSRVSGRHTGATDRLVVLFSHHGLSTLVNDTRNDVHSDPVHLAAEVEKLLHNYPNVVLWLSGHTHVNKVTPRPRPASPVGPPGGFWEVSTSSIAEWPVQARLLEIYVDDRFVRIRTTMIDSATPVTPNGGTQLADLAGLHREIAANDPDGVGGRDAEGGPDDRNVELLVPLPFPR